MKFKIEAMLVATIDIEADTEAEAQSAIMIYLHQADTDFIRSGHWSGRPMVAEFEVRQCLTLAPE